MTSQPPTTPPQSADYCPLTSVTRLHKIDQLRAKNIGAYLPLPQLVAVGDQSSGKSSLLETLSGIPFPRGQELCTRYATQITHRREDHPRIHISVIPGPHASAEDKKRMEAYQRQAETTAQLRQEFMTILEEVNTLMDIRTLKNPKGGKTFTEDVLKIEKCGPNEDYLTIIDVPGIFRSTTEGVTTKGDKELVKNMVKRYINDSRTIILAVLPSNVDVATQEILEFAEESDKTGQRTLGILTKPDLVKERTAKLSVCGLVEGKRKPLKLGYYLVRNRGGDDDGDDDSVASLRQREAMFQEFPWNTLPADRLGAQALREQLEELLGQITDGSFPELRAEVRSGLERAQRELTDLGPSRQTRREQQMYLTGVAGDFQQLVRAALNAEYSTHHAFCQKELRLITAIVNITEQFNSDFENFGRTYLFQDEEEIACPASTSVVTVSSQKDDANCEAGSGTDTGDNLNIPSPDAYPDLAKIISRDWSMKKPKRGILSWIDYVFRKSRGQDLGTFGNTIILSVFREQSSRWETIAKQYLSKIILVVHRFVLTALEVVCKDSKVREELIYAILSDLLLRYEGGMEQATFLVNVERQLKPYTLDRHFNQNYQKKTGNRVKETLRPHARKEYLNSQVLSRLVVNLNNVADAVSNQSNTEHAKESIHDILEAYYEVAYKRFVDNVFSQAVDYKLLSGSSTPLSLFSTQWVLELDDDRLLSLAGESRGTRDRRQRLQKKIQDFDEAMHILR